VGVYLATEFQRLPLQLIEVVKIIVLSKKTRGAIIPSLDDMPWDTG
jgi:hypothetical protein